MWFGLPKHTGDHPSQMGSDITSVLFITSTPDDRHSTHRLALLAHEMGRQPGVTTHMWYLRNGNSGSLEHGTRVMDSLRTWTPSVILDRIGASVAAAHLRGLRLRVWLRRIKPDVVVLDDGLGRRVIEALRPSPRIVVRLNQDAPEHLHMEPPATEPADADLVIVPYGHGSPTSQDSSRMIEEFPTIARSTAAGRMADVATMRSVRRRLGLPEEQTLVVGWGDDGWLDGPELFIRFLWTLEHHQGVRAHGVWFGLTSDHNEMGRLAAEARRCGLGDRFHHLPANDTDSHMCGDGVFLPYRSAVSGAELDNVLEVACSGSLTVTFEAILTDDPLIHRVANLDLELAAATMAEGLAADRASRSGSARLRSEALPHRILALTSEPARRR